MNTADKCRAMGLQVGDTIEGKQGVSYWTEWDITRLTLLWLGDEVVVWSQTHTNHMTNEWTPPKEEACWSLDYRDWRPLPEAL